MALFTDRENVVTLSRHLSWSHFLALIPIKKAKARMFYASTIKFYFFSFIMKP